MMTEDGEIERDRQGERQGLQTKNRSYIPYEIFRDNNGDAFVSLPSPLARNLEHVARTDP
jgi:hypothetical protein